ncbi:VWA domain-containing protein [Enterococcus hulanensis]|uniref:vWA domain-containing protein n=1 Tax=Enterococcus hulanensis TaxID=2559929 RepID=UPI001A8D451C|nr:vWA domain-containing protein [Enterococcus hulanensis]MBO0455361.1 VWA domain-containing protein [Enterococcus hulanensis]
MKKINLIVLLMMFFSFVIENFTSIQVTHAETTKIALIDEDYLKLDYDYKTKEDSTQWKLTFKRQSETENLHQRLKFKITDKKDAKVDYPVVENMEEKEDWLVEENFTEQMDGQIVLDLPKSVETLQLYVQMDQKGAAEEAEIKEDILEQEKPYILEVKKESKSKKSEAETKTTSSSSESKEKTTFIGPQLSPQADTAPKRAPMNNAYQNQYDEKTPQYTGKFPESVYPTNSWSPTGQAETIKNHQGGHSVDPENVWDGNTEWDIAQDDRSKSYIHYGDDKTNPNLGMRKLAFATDKEDEFNIRLNVQGNTTYKPGVDIVFLIDATGTMSSGNYNGTNRKERAHDALRTMVDRLIDSKVDENIRIGGYFFSTGEFEKDFGTQYSFELSSDETKWNNIVKSYGNVVVSGPTFTQRGLMKAEDIFNRGDSDGKGRKKLLFVLTDGAPNSSYKPAANPEATKNGSVYLDYVHIKNWNMTDDLSTKPPYIADYGSSLGASANRTKFDSAIKYDGLPIASHLTTTNSTAYDLKENGIEIHTVSVGISTGDKEHSTAVLKAGLARMATKKAHATGDDNSDYFYNSVSDKDDLTEGIKEWYDTVISTVNHGIITDPINDMFELVSGPTMTTYDANGNPNTLNPKPGNPTVNSSNEIILNDLSLKKGEQVQIDYRVRLKTDDSRFKKGVWYQTNGPTTLQPTPERTGDELDFGVPSVRIKADEIISIPVKKVWANDKVNNVENYWERREPVTVELQKKNGSWTKLAEKVLSKDNQWKSSFDNIVDERGSVYRVVEKTQPAGHTVSYSPEEFTKAELGAKEVTVTNTLKRTKFEFDKFMNDGNTPFPTTGRPVFQIEDTKSHKTLTNVSPNGAGAVIFENLPIGTYTVSETSVPTGYEKMPDFKVTIEEAGNGDLITKVNGSTNRHKVVNLLQDFKLEVTKTDTLDELLSGASFRLRGPNGYDKTLKGGSSFIFDQLKPGRYLLTESETPSGFSGLDKDIEITISDLGEVQIEKNDLVSGFGNISAAGNRISLTVKNKKLAGQAPSTGGEGRNKLMMVSAGLIGISSLVGLLYFVLNRKNF